MHQRFWPSSYFSLTIKQHAVGIESVPKVFLQLANKTVGKKASTSIWRRLDICQRAHRQHMCPPSMIGWLLVTRIPREILLSTYLPYMPSVYISYWYIKKKLARKGWQFTDTIRETWFYRLQTSPSKWERSIYKEFHL